MKLPLWLFSIDRSGAGAVATVSTTEVAVYTTSKMSRGTDGRFVEANVPVRELNVMSVKLSPLLGVNEFMRLTFRVPFKVAVPVRLTWSN